MKRPCCQTQLLTRCRLAGIPCGTSQAAFLSLIAVSLLGIGVPGLPLFGQGSQADYTRAAELAGRSAGKVYRDRVNPVWLEHGEGLWYRVSTGPNAWEFVYCGLTSGTRSPLFDHAVVAEQIGGDVKAEQLPLEDIRLAREGGWVLFRVGQQWWRVPRHGGDCQPIDADALPDSWGNVLGTLPHSSRSGSRVNVQFVNDTDAAIQVWWIDPRGRRQTRGKIEPGDVLDQSTFAGHTWIFTDEAESALAIFEAVEGMDRYRVTKESKLGWTPPPERRRPRRFGGVSRAESPDGQWRVTSRDENLIVTSTETGEERQLGSVTGESKSWLERRLVWSPDSRFVIAFENEPGDDRKIVFVESAPRDQLQPRLHEVPYPKPGDELQRTWPRLFDVVAGTEIPLDRSRFANPWSLTDFRFREDSSEFSFLYNRRGHQVVQVLAVSTEDGSIRTVIDETTETFVDYTNKVFSSYDEERDEIVWMTERSGWNHLVLYQGSTGSVLRSLTDGPWVVREVDRVDHDQRQIFFQASGVIPDHDPYYIHHCRVDMDSGELVVLTEGDGTHEIEYSPDGRFFIDRYSRVDLPGVTEVRRGDDGSRVAVLEEADWKPLLETGWKPPVRFVAAGRDGATDIHGILCFPSNFDESATYPVIEYIYAGPHDSFVPKAFFVTNQMRAMAELGFIVVQIDGMGTSNRSKAFHDVCWKNLGDSGFPDRIVWIQAAAESYPQMDLSRVGIYGGSAGGQSALRALLAHGDFYQAAVADCGCHDNRMDKVWWNEQWMGWPVGPHYEEQSNVTQAHRLAGKLLLIVGELDRNVDPASTMQVVDALIRADKDFDLLVVPGAGHGIGSGAYGMRRTRDFFVRHLLGREPRWSPDGGGP